MDMTLSKEQRALQDRARRFFEEVLAPLETVVEEAGHLPHDRRPAVRQAVVDWGFAGINHAKEDGGLGLSTVDQMLIEEQLGRASCGLWTLVWRPAVCLKQGTAAQRAAYLVPACRGERRAAYAISEPGAGSDPRMIQTKAVRKGDRFVLTGEKWFVTSFDACDFLIVQANVEGDPDKPTLFFVSRDAPGLVHQRSPGFMHTWPFDHAEIRLEGVEVGAEDILGSIGGGFELTKDWFVEARLQIAAHGLGAATRAAEIALDYAKRRVQFGKAIADFQAIELKLGDMAVELMAAQTLLYRIASEIDRGADRKRIHAQASALKLFVSETAGRVIDQALQILAGRGYMRENPVERLYRDIRVDRIWEGTSEIQRIIIAGQVKKRGLELYTRLPEREG